MNPLFSLCALAFACGLSQAEDADIFATHVRTTPWLSPEDERKGFELPEGFDITLFASEPQIAKPLNMAFDAKGRLWLTNTVEYPFPAPPERAGRDSVRILEDTDGDGHADKVTTFADGLNIPIGITPYGDGAICFSIPDILYLRDKDGDGICDRREKLYGPFDCTRDTHGMVNSFLPRPDGWIYACHGFNNASKVAGSDGHVVEMQSGNVFRFRPDGSRIEIYTHGMVNPFGLAADDHGDLFAADCHTKPVSLLVPGGYHQSFGKPHDGLGFIPNVMEHIHGSTAICGLAFGSATTFPEAFRDSAFSGNVVTCRINRNRMTYRGSSPQAVEQPDFLVSRDPWFRPVDLKAGPDGALYVADFYNAVIGHYEMPLDHPKRDRTSGRIWRISHRGATTPPRQPDVSPPDAAFDAPDPRARRAAVTAASVRLLEEQIPPLFAVLESCPPDDPQLRYATRLALRNHLRREDWFATLAAAGLSPVRLREISDLCLALKTPSAALFLLRHLDASPGMPRPLLEEYLQTAARHAEPYALDEAIASLRQRYADQPEIQSQLILSLRKGLQLAGKDSPSSLLAWATDLARGLLASGDGQQPLPWTPLPYPDTATATGVWDVSRTRKSADGQENTPLWSSFPRGETGTGVFRSTPFVADASLSFYLAGHDGYPDKPPGEKNFAALRDAGSDAVLFRATAPRNDVAQPVVWDTQSIAGKRVFVELTDGDDAVAYAWLAAGRFSVAGLNPPAAGANRALAAELIAALRLSPLRDAAAEALRAETPGGDTAKQLAHALAALAGDVRAEAVAEVLCMSAGSDEIGSAAIECLASGDLGGAEAILRAALRQLPSPQQQYVSERLSGSADGIETLLGLIESGSTAGADLRQPVVSRNLDAVATAAQRARAEEILKAAPATAADIQQRIAERVRQARENPGDPEAGRLVFQQQCAVCHQVAGQGGTLAPNLDGIGSRGLDRLCEDLFDPNRNVDIAFRVTTLVRQNGEALTGFVRREESGQLILADASGRESVLPKSEIARRLPSALSLMPPTFDRTLGDDQSRDLLSWLLSLR